MNPASKQRSVLLVSEDWFSQSLLVQVARDTGLFTTVFAVDDGYSALAVIWQCVIDGWCPDAVLIDHHAPAPSAGGFINALRSDDETRSIVIGLLASADDCPAPMLPAARVDVFSTCEPMHPELPMVFQALSTRLDLQETARLAGTALAGLPRGWSPRGLRTPGPQW